MRWAFLPVLLLACAKPSAPPADAAAPAADAAAPPADAASPIEDASPSDAARDAVASDATAEDASTQDAGASGPLDGTAHYVKRRGTTLESCVDFHVVVTPPADAGPGFEPPANARAILRGERPKEGTEKVAKPCRSALMEMPIATCVATYDTKSKTGTVARYDMTTHYYDLVAIAHDDAKATCATLKGKWRETTTR